LLFDEGNQNRILAAKECEEEVCVIFMMVNGSVDAVPIQHLSEWGKIESEVVNV